jgi:EamA domain-containing membrane protein RarD
VQIKTGIIGMVVAMALFTANDICVKIVAQFLPTGQVMSVRGAFAFLMAGVIVFAMRESPSLKNAFSADSDAACGM